MAGPLPPNTKRVELPPGTRRATGVGAAARQFGYGAMGGLGAMLPPPPLPSLGGHVPGRTGLEDAPWWVPRRDITTEGLEAVHKFLETPGIEHPPATPGQAMAKRVGEQVGYTIPFLPIPVGPAILRGVQGAGTVGKNVDRALGTEALFTGATGGGAAIAGQAAPGSLVADIAGQVAGTGVAAAAPGGRFSILGWTYRGGRAIWGRISPTARAERGVAQARRTVGDIPPADLARGQEVAQTIPGLRPTIAEATGRPDLVAAQTRIEAGMTGAEATGQRARRELGQEALDAFTEANAPGVRQPPEVVVDVATGAVEDVRSGMAAQRGAVATQATDLVEATQRQAGRARETLAGQQAATTAEREGIALSLPDTDLAALGGDIRGEFIAAETAARSAMTARREELGLSNVNMFVPFQSFRNVVGETFKGRRLADPKNIPDAVSRILDTKGRVTFADLMDLRQAITNDIRLASSGATANPMLRGQNQLLLHMLDERLLGETSGRAFGELAKAYKTFRREYFTNVIEPFENNVVYRVTQTGGRGFYTTRDEQVAGLFFTKGGVTQAKQFNQVFAGNPAMQDALVTAALDSLRRSAVRDGVLDQRRFHAWLRDHNSVIAEFPGLGATVRSVANVNEGLAVRAQQLVGRERQIQDSALARELRIQSQAREQTAIITAAEKGLGTQSMVRELDAYSRAAMTSEQVIASALKDPRKMSALRDLVKDNPDALAALQRQVWDVVDSRDPAAVAQFIQDNGKVLAQVLDFRHLSDLQIIADARIMAARVPDRIGTAPAGLDPVRRMGQALGQNPRSAIAQWLGVQRGRSSPWVEVGAAVGRFVSVRAESAMDAALREALYDPEIARAFAQQVINPTKAPENLKTLRAWWLGAALSTQDNE